MRSCEDAAALAAHLHDAVLLGEAALVLHDVSDPSWLTVTSRWCRTALAGLPGQDSALSARLMSQVAVAKLWDDDEAGADATAAAAMEMAERLDDTTARVSALHARQLTRSGPDGTHDRLRLGERMVGLARTAGDPTLLWGRLWRFDALVQLGRLDEAETELDLIKPVAERIRRSLPAWHLIRSRAALLCARGRFSEARAAADESVRVAREGRHRAAEFPALALRSSISLLTGDPIDPAVFEVERYQPPPRLLSLMTAEWHTIHGDPADAEQIYARLPPPAPVGVKPFMHLVFHACSGTVAAALGDTATAAHAYEQLAPYADLHVAAGAGAGFTRGSVHLALGTIAASRERTDSAIDHLRRAVTSNASSGLAPHAALAQIRLAEQLRRRARAGDADDASAAAAEATTTAARLGMPLP
jgi:tetratricopeptide (TPR) repeat protein